MDLCVSVSLVHHGILLPIVHLEGTNLVGGAILSFQCQRNSGGFHYKLFCEDVCFIFD